MKFLIRQCSLNRGQKIRVLRLNRCIKMGYHIARTINNKLFKVPKKRCCRRGRQQIIGGRLIGKYANLSVKLEGNSEGIFYILLNIDNIARLLGTKIITRKR